MFVTSCDEHGDGCLHTCYYYRANGQEVCLSDKCSDNFLYVGFFCKVFYSTYSNLRLLYWANISLAPALASMKYFSQSKSGNSKKLKKSSITGYAKLCLIFTLFQIIATFLFYYLRFRNSIETPKEGKTRRNETDM